MRPESRETTRKEGEIKAIVECIDESVSSDSMKNEAVT